MQSAGEHHGEEGDEQHAPAESCSALPLLRNGGAGGQAVEEAYGGGGAGGDPMEGGESPEQEEEEEGLLEEVVKDGKVEAGDDSLRGVRCETAGGDGPEDACEEQAELEGAGIDGLDGGIGQRDLLTLVRCGLGKIPSAAKAGLVCWFIGGTKVPPLQRMALCLLTELIVSPLQKWPYVYWRN
jgi:hypothetical protein